MDFQTGSGGPTTSFRSTQDVIVYGRWHHVARQSAAAKLYVDGREVPCQGAIEPSFRTKAVWLFGADPLTACGYHGMLDDLRIYNRVLSHGEIQNLQRLVIP